VALGALIADAEMNSKLRLQQLHHELEELAQEHQIALKKAVHLNDLAEEEIRKLEIQTTILRAKNALELEVLQELKIKAAEKQLEKELAK
jgi:hypothetical protein